MALAPSGAEILTDPGFDNAAKWTDYPGAGVTGWLISGGVAAYPGGAGSAWEMDTADTFSLPAGDYTFKATASSGASAVLGLYAKTGNLGQTLVQLFFSGAGQQIDGFTLVAPANGFTVRAEGSNAITLTDISVKAGASGVVHTYGPDLMGNGTFTGNDATGWGLVRCSISGDALNVVNSTGFSGQANYTVPTTFVANIPYTLDFDVVNFVSKNAFPYSAVLGGGSGANYTPANGHFSITVVAATVNNNLRLSVPNGSNFQIDNIVLKQRLT